VALGLAHGPTELLPISSSAHTTLIPWLAGWPYVELDPELRKSFEVALHAGTAAALLIDLARVESHPGLRAVLDRVAALRDVTADAPDASSPPDPSSPPDASSPTDASSTGGASGASSSAAAGTTEISASRATSAFPPRQALLIALSFIPPAVVGFTFEQPLQRRLSGLPTIAAGLLAGAVAMALADSRPADGVRTLDEARVIDGLLLGLAQTCALVPGVSRSGAVLSTARARGFSRADSHTLSRRTGLPVILGAGALKTGRLLQRGLADGGTDRGTAGALLIGGGASFLSTLAVTRLLRRSSRSASATALWPYSLYRGLLSCLVISRLRRAHNRST
jgi:undecaprenyl pyrophosphate phosphatase UppP